MIFSSLNMSSIRLLMRMYTSSQAKRKRIHRKSEFQMFVLNCGHHIGVPMRYTNMASPYKAL